jgi:alkanesulfonate monooxygenase SsuD/methylene tetrahydromethanopterin reductase-like flavin-dependent oxidoreductase (luciferase family)
MEFGMFYEFPVRKGYSEADAFSEGFELIDDAERLGLDATWLSESHVQPNRSVLASPMVIASAIAGRTKRIKIGLAVQVLPLGNPLRLAEEAATVDQISRGRLVFGIGRSGNPRAYEAYGVPYDESRERFAETLEIILKAWTQPTFSYEGRWHSYSNVGLAPKPFQKPHPEIRIAANSPASFVRFGERGHSIFVGLRQGGVSQLVPHVQAYREAYRAAGHPGNGGVYIRAPLYVAATAEQALTEPEESFTDFYQRRGTRSTRQVAHAGGTALMERDGGLDQPPLVTWDELRDERVIVGTPAQVGERLHELKNLLGLDGILAELNCGGKIPLPQVKQSLRLLCEDVKPAFHDL